jgi:hypothetical protein
LRIRHAVFNIALPPSSPKEILPWNNCCPSTFPSPSAISRTRGIFTGPSSAARRAVRWPTASISISSATTSSLISVRHFGVIVPLERWHALADRMVKAGVKFVMPPQVRYPGEVREQAILLCEDNCGNVLEFKGQPAERIFATA